MLTIKLAEEQMKELGVTSSEQVFALLQKPQTENKPSEGAQAFAAFESRLAAVEAKQSKAPQSVDLTALRAEILQAAKVESIASASGAVSAAIAKSGGAAIAPKETVSVDPDAKTQIAETDFEARFKADPKLEMEFGTIGAFSAYERARLSGKFNL